MWKIGEKNAEMFPRVYPESVFKEDIAKMTKKGA